MVRLDGGGEHDGGPLNALLAIAATALTVEDFATRDLWHAHPSERVGHTREFMSDRGYDVAPLKEEPVARFVTLRGLMDGDVEPSSATEDWAMPIAAPHLVTGSLGVPGAVLALAKQPFFFVLDGSRVNGLVTLSDLQRPAVGMVALALILAIESGLNQLIPRFWGDAWLDGLSLVQQRQVEEVFSDRVRHSTEITRLECLTTVHRVTLVLKSRVLWSTLGFRSQREARSQCGHVVKLRNTLAHGNGLLDATGDPIEAASWFSAIDRLAQTVRSVVDVEHP